MKFFSSTFNLIKESAKGWIHHDAMVWCAAQAYFAIFAIGPIFLIIISFLGLFLGESEVQNKILSQSKGYFGDKGSEMLKTIIEQQKKPSTSFFSMLFGGIALLVTALGAFSQLQSMLNRIWGVTSKTGSAIIAILWQRLLTFIMLIIISLIFLALMLASTAVSSLTEVIQKEISIPAWVIGLVNFIITFGILTILLSFIFKVLPDVEIKWANVFLGAFITAILFYVGKSLISLYISKTTATGYGAAASFVVLLLWFYYSSLIFFFGAEFTRVYTLEKEGKIIPGRYAELKKGD